MTTTTTTTLCNVTVDLENSNPSFEIVSPELMMEEEHHADSKRSNTIDTSCCSGRTCSTGPLSDCEDEYDSHLWNTHLSILNLTGSEDEDEEEDEENEPMPEQLLDTLPPSTSPEFAPQDALTVSAESSIATQKDDSIMDRVGDMMDSFCAPSVVTPSCTSHQPSNSDPRLEQDLVQLMSCFPPPDAQEMKVFSNTQRLLNRLFCHKQDDSLTGRQAPTVPQKSCIHQRCRKIHRLLHARRLPEGATLRTVQSFALVANPNIPEDDATYDSDPEDLVWSHKRQHSPPRRKQLPITPTIQQTLNTTWDLLLHTGDSLQTVRVWMERGTLIHSHSMIEPRLMWRTNTMEKPKSLWLLQIARIRACDASDLPVLAQPHTSFILRTHHESFCFQATNTKSRENIITAWKACIARFAALAVLEDANAILNEFFVLPTL